MKDPAFLFYSSDFLSGTMLMSNEEVGIYIKLLCLQHQQGHLREDDMLSMGATKKIFSKFIKDNEGTYYNERLEYEANKRKAYSESRRNNRKKKETYEEDMKNICNTYEKHMGNENGNININDIKNKDNRKKGSKGKRKEEKTFDDIFAENNFSVDLEKAIKDFIEMRKIMKKPMTVRALELLLKNLQKLTNLEDEKIAIINQSIERGWQTVYPLKEYNLHHSNGGRNE